MLPENLSIPPPRPKRKPAHPYPRKAEPQSSEQLRPAQSGSGSLPTLAAAAAAATPSQQQHGASAQARGVSPGPRNPVGFEAGGTSRPSPFSAVQQQVHSRLQLSHTASGGSGAVGADRQQPLEGHAAAVAAVAAAASAAAAAAAAAVVAAAEAHVQASLQANPPKGFPFFGLPPSILATMGLQLQSEAQVSSGVKPLDSHTAPSMSLCSAAVSASYTCLALQGMTAARLLCAVSLPQRSPAYSEQYCSFPALRACIDRLRARIPLQASALVDQLRLQGQASGAIGSLSLAPSLLSPAPSNGNHQLAHQAGASAMQGLGQAFAQSTLQPANAAALSTLARLACSGGLMGLTAAAAVTAPTPAAPQQPPLAAHAPQHGARVEAAAPGDEHTATNATNVPDGRPGVAQACCKVSKAQAYLPQAILTHVQFLWGLAHDCACTCCAGDRRGQRRAAPRQQQAQHERRRLGVQPRARGGRHSIAGECRYSQRCSHHRRGRCSRRLRS